MAEKCKTAADSSISKKKVRLHLESYLNFVSIEGQDKSRPECVICIEAKQNETTPGHKTLRDFRGD